MEDSIRRRVYPGPTTPMASTQFPCLTLRPSTAATAGAVEALASSVFVDVAPQALTLCPDDLARQTARVREARRLRPRAVIPVDLFGYPADLSAVGTRVKAAEKRLRTGRVVVSPGMPSLSAA